MNVDSVWLLNKKQEVQIPMYQLKLGDIIAVRTGSMIPVDGEIYQGECLINEASITGEGLLVDIHEKKC